MIRINHIAIAVNDLQEAQRFWVHGLGLNLERIEDIDAEAVKVAFLTAGSGEIELVQPTNADSGVSRYLQKRGPGMHHVCFEVPDIEEAMERLRRQQVELINETPRQSPDGRLYAFVHPRSAHGVLVELYQASPE